MEKFLEFLKNLADRYNESSPGRRTATLTAAAAALAAIFVMSLWIQAPDYQLLFANLSPEDAGAIVDELKTRNIDYKLTHQGRGIQIPSRQVYETRLALASKGLPEGTEVGFELFEDNLLGMSDFVQNLNYQRALQGELSRTIKSLDAIDQARVHLVIPKKELFLREKPKGKASVTIKVKAGKTLSESQIQGIVHLISGSVESINSQDVVIVDLRGNILSGAGEGSQSALITTTNFAHKRKVEKELEENIVKMFEKALGAGKVIARVSARMDFNKEDSTEEIFDPDSQVARTEQSDTELEVNALSADESVEFTGSPRLPSKREVEKSVLSYEINKIVRHTVKPAGQIISLSVGVLIDGTLSGDPPVYKPRRPEEMAKFTAIVKSIIGFDASRNDQIEVENVQFDKTFNRELERQLSQDKIYDLAFEVAKILLGIIFLVLLFTRIIRPLITWAATSMETAPRVGRALPADEREALEPGKKLTPSGFETSDIRKSVLSYIESDPKHAAGIIRKWMRDRTPV